MSRFIRALAATAMAVAAAGGGLLMAAAGAAPAYASAPAAPAGPAAPPGAHTITVTLQPTARAASGVGSHALLPCATKGASCVPPTVTCHVHAPTPALVHGYQVTASADVQCNEEMEVLTLDETLLKNNAQVDWMGDVETDSKLALTAVSAICQPGTYTNHAEVSFTAPAGYTVVTPSPIVVTSAPLQVPPEDCTPIVGGGGGGCATATPSLSAQPAGRYPDAIICQ